MTRGSTTERKQCSQARLNRKEIMKKKNLGTSSSARRQQNKLSSTAARIPFSPLTPSTSTPNYRSNNIEEVGCSTPITDLASNISFKKMLNTPTITTPQRIPLSPLTPLSISNRSATNVQQLRTSTRTNDENVRPTVDVEITQAVNFGNSAGSSFCHRGHRKRKIATSNTIAMVPPLSIPELNITETEDGFSNEQENTRNENADDVSELYSQAEVHEILDLGDPTLICRYCQSIVWYDERSDKSKKSNNPDFSICCMKGKIQLPTLDKPPPLLFGLMSDEDSRSKHFKDNIRAYNNMFSFTSIGGKVESSINNGSGPPQFILSGQNFHRIGSLLPTDGTPPKFAQLYIYDTYNENYNRMRNFSSSDRRNTLDESLVEDLKQMVDRHNPYAKSFRRVRDFMVDNEEANFALRLFRARNRDPRIYNLPTSDEVAALIIGDMNIMDLERDIVVKKMSGELKRLHETHTDFIPLQYPLLFPYGEDGYKEDIPLRESEIDTIVRKRVRVTMREFISYRIQDRTTEYGNVVNSKRLFQQFVVDCYTMIESQRLSFIRNNQTLIRAEVLNGLQEAVSRGETDPASVGTRVILPASFTGGARYMFNNCQDAMAICKKFGYPDLFITITCNSNWNEIQRFVASRKLRPDDRPDIVCRVFKMKLDQMMTDFKKEQIFGKVDAGMYSVEFQKRGLPHAHILLWLNAENKLTTTADIDKYISAELPNPEFYPRLSQAVTKFMVHGPCGAANLSSPCMKDRRCTKFFPKRFQNSTQIDEDGYPTYKRRDSGITVKRKGIEMDNRNVVPYNPQLIVRYNAHVNMEYCNKSNAIKYLFKYVNKGPDRVTAEISGQNQLVIDEIKQYYDCRYLSPCEAVWRIFGYDIHHRWPPVQRLTFHLPNNQRVLFKDDERIDDVLKRTKENETMFLAWMIANQQYAEGRDLTYGQFPSRFVYNKDSRRWQPRKMGYSIGRLHYVPPGTGELYYMRILLTCQKGCTSFDSIKTVDGRHYDTFQEACYALGLLADDKEYIDAIKEASELGSGSQIRKLFATLLQTNTISNPAFVWDKCWMLLADGIVYHRRRDLNLPGLHIDEGEIKNLCLIELEKILQSNGRSLREFRGLPYPNMSEECQFHNRFIVDEMNYNRPELQQTHQSLIMKLTAQQRKVYDQIMKAVLNESGGFYFVYGYGGTGKTFIWNTLSSGLRCEGYIVVNVASSGIASLLLPGGRTAHSRFSIPLSVNDSSTCNIKQGSPKAELLQAARLIIWDEAPMLNRFCFEALDRTLRDLMRSKNPNSLQQPFGGKVVVLGGDFRQILPVINKGSRQDIVSAAINSSYLWKFCKVLTLTENMRLRSDLGNTNAEDIAEFAQWILRIGDGDTMANESGDAEFEIPTDLVIEESVNPLLPLVNFAYPDLLQSITDYTFFQDRAILAPTLESVEKVNNFILDMIPGEEKEYLSSDYTCKSDEDTNLEGEWFTTEFLNDIKCSGLPNHRLVFKIGVPVMLLRNIDQSGGLCNGTRLIVNDLGKNIIGATVVTGPRIGDKIYIARMNLIPSDSGLPFKFERRQFPLVLSFAMTINKSQGQSLSHVGLFLPRPVFTHGQLYVAVSRVRSRKGLKILILDDEDKVSNVTKNVVYKEVFENL